MRSANLPSASATRIHAIGVDPSEKLRAVLAFEVPESQSEPGRIRFIFRGLAVESRAVRWLGVDPGSRHCGWGIVEREGARSVAVAWGRLSPDPGLPLARRLAEIADGLARVVVEHRPEHAAVECVYQGPSARSLVVLAEARGAILAELARQGLAVREITPAEVKSAVAGSGRADKRQVARMVALLVGLPSGSVADDAADALAVALADMQRESFERAVARSR